MTERALSEDVRRFLEVYFPGSSLDDGYYFVEINGAIHRRVNEDALQQVADRLASGKCWLVAVGVDPRPHVNARREEERVAIYTPDWNVERKLAQWLVEITASKVDLLALLAAEQTPGALVLIAPDQRVVLDANMRRLYATSEQELRSLTDGIDQCFVGEVSGATGA